MKKQINEEIKRMQIIAGIIKEGDDEWAQTQRDAKDGNYTADGVKIEREMDGIKFISWMKLTNALESRHEQQLGNLDFLQKEDAVEKLAMEWISKNNAYLHEFWADDEGGYGAAVAKAYYDAADLAKQENKNIVVLLYNS